MHLDKRINSSEYLDKVIRHLTSTYQVQELSSEDLTALLLLIYFKRDFNMEDISEYLGEFHLIFFVYSIFNNCHLHCNAWNSKVIILFFEFFLQNSF